MDSYQAATRILIVYESYLPFGRQANFAERVEAMNKTIKALGLKETNSGAELSEIARAAVDEVDATA